MRKRLTVLLVLVLPVTLAIVVGWRPLRPPPHWQAEFDGRTTAEWEVELCGWKVDDEYRHYKYGQSVLWGRQGLPFQYYLVKLRLVSRDENADVRRVVFGLGRTMLPELPLMDNDPAAVPVLTELLESRNALVRRVAAQALRSHGRHATAAKQALTAALDDASPDVSRDAAETLWDLDRPAVEKAGFRWVKGEGPSRVGLGKSKFTSENP